MYKCQNCENEFEYTKKINTTHESYTGVYLETNTPLELFVCPSCNSEDIELEREGVEEC